RFIGWLILGLSVYASYGYAHSELGRKLGRPSRTPVPLQFAALGFLLAAVGLFVIPHDAGPRQLWRYASVDSPQHLRTVLGLTMIGLGVTLGAAGTVRLASAGKQSEELA